MFVCAVYGKKIRNGWVEEGNWEGEKGRRLSWRFGWKFVFSEHVGPYKFGWEGRFGTSIHHIRSSEIDRYSIPSWKAWQAIHFKVTNDDKWDHRDTSLRLRVAIMLYLWTRKWLVRIPGGENWKINSSLKGPVELNWKKMANWSNYSDYGNYNVKNETRSIDFSFGIFYF